MATTNPTLYFLRSSEQHILNKMLPLSLDAQQNVEFFGFTRNDLGLYALIDNHIAGAVWVRLKDFNDLPVLNIAVKPEFRANGVAKVMLEQLFAEAGVIFEKLEVKFEENKNVSEFLQKFGFSESNGSMIKVLEKKEHLNIYDDYGSCKWMEP